MHVQDPVLFDPCNRTKCSQLSGCLNWAWSGRKVRASLGPVLCWRRRGCSSAPCWPSPSAAVELIWSDGAWAAASKLFDCRHQSLHRVTACAGGWCKPIDVDFGGISMDQRGLSWLASLKYRCSLLLLFTYLLTPYFCSMGLAVSWNKLLW